MRTWPSFLSSAALAALLVAAGPGETMAEDRPTVRLLGAASTIEPYHGFMFVGIPLGFYEELGVDAEFNTIGGSTAAIQLVGAGQADIAYVGMSALAIAKATQPTLPVKAVYLHDRGNIYEIVVPADSDIQSVADLDGRNIGVANLASGAIPMLKAMLAEAGLNPDASVGLIPVGVGAQAAISLEQGRVDALSLFRAQHALLETLGVELRFFQKEMPSAVLAANVDFMQRDPEAVIRALQGVIQSTVFVQANAEEAVRTHWAMFGQPTGLDEETALARGTHLIQRAAELWKDPADDSVRWGEMTEAEWDAVQAFMVEQGLLDEKVPNDLLFTNAFIDAINEVDIGPALEKAGAK